MKKSLLLGLISFSCFCQDIDCKGKVTEVKGNNGMLYMTDILNGVLLIRNTNKDSEFNYSVAFFTTSNSLFQRASGYYILFEDGKTIEDDSWLVNLMPNPKKIHGDGQYEYSTFIPLREDEFRVFSEKKIAARKIYVFDLAIEEEFQTKIKESAYCLLNFVSTSK